MTSVCSVPKGEIKNKLVSSDIEKQKDILKNLTTDKILLCVLWFFQKSGREEVSISEFLDSIKHLNEKINLNYKFSDRFLYSVDLMDDLRELKYKRYVRQWKYVHDAFLPKTFLALTTLGKGACEKIIKDTPSDFVEILNIPVKEAIKNYQESWRLFARPALTR